MSLKDYGSKLNNLREERERFLELIHSLDKKVARGEITRYQKNFAISSITHGISERDYLRSFEIEMNRNEQLAADERAKSPAFKNIIKTSIAIFGIILLLIILIVPGLIQFGNQDIREYSLTLNKSYFAGSQNFYPLNTSRDSTITSMRLNGVYSGDVQIYLVSNDTGARYLVFDSKKYDGDVVSITGNLFIVKGNPGTSGTKLNNVCDETCKIIIDPITSHLEIDLGKDGFIWIENVTYSQVVVNHAPTQVKDINDIIITDTQRSMDFSTYFNDEEGDKLTYTLSNIPGVSIISNDNIVTFNVPKNVSTSFSGFLYVSDGRDKINSNVFKIIVNTTIAYKDIVKANNNTQSANNPSNKNNSIDNFPFVKTNRTVDANSSLTNRTTTDVNSNRTINDTINQVINNIDEYGMAYGSGFNFKIDDKLRTIWDQNSSSNQRVIIKYKDANTQSSNDYINSLSTVLDARKTAHPEDFDINALNTRKTQLKGMINASISKQLQQDMKKQKTKGLTGYAVDEIVSDNITNNNSENNNSSVDELNTELLGVEQKLIVAQTLDQLGPMDSVGYNPDAKIEVLKANYTDIGMLRLNSLIDTVYIDEPMEALILDSMNIMRVNDAWNLSTNISNSINNSINGTNISVCVLDTGINFGVILNAVNGYNFVSNNDNSSDDNGHGTSVSNAIYNIAPDSKIISVKVIDINGTGYESWIISGLQYCQDQNVSIISMSIGGGDYSGFCDSNPVAQKVDELVNAGITVIAATGNDGSNNSIKNPACAHSAIRVGASTKNDELWYKTNYNNATLILAPGNRINTIDLKGRPIIVSGTSMSAAMVSGVVALLQEHDTLQNNILTPNETYYRLINTGRVINATDYSFTDSVKQFSRVDALNALLNNITNNLTEGNVDIFDNNTFNETSNDTNETFGTLIDVSSCNTYAASNTVYNVTANFSSTGDCIFLTGNNVTFDCRGYTITFGTGGGDYTIGIGVLGNNITVKNCNIISQGGMWNYAIMTSANGSTFVNNSVIGSAGTLGYSGETGSSYVNITNNTAVVGLHGVYFEYSNNNSVTYNTLTSSSHRGINSDTSNGSTFRNNIIKSYLAGILLSSSSNNVIINNSATSTYDEGSINVFQSNNNNFSNNTAISNAINGDAVDVDSSNNTNFIGQTAIGNSTSSIGVLISASSNTLFQDCVNISGTTNDVQVENYASNSTFANCTYHITAESVEIFSNLTRQWYLNTNITNAGGSPLSGANVTIYNKTGALVYSGVTGINGDITRAVLTEYRNVGGTYTYQTNHTVNVSLAGYNSSSKTYNITNLTNVFAAITLATNGSTISNCSVLSNANTEYDLTQNVSKNGANCFNITAQNITLDCKGYNITGNNATNTAGVYSTVYNTTIKNCNIFNFSAGIIFSGATNGTIQNTNISTNQTSDGGSNGIGIYFTASSSGSSIINSNVIAFGQGIHLANANSNTLSNLNIISNQSAGINIDGGSNNILSNVKVTTYSNVSIYIYSGSNNTLSNFTVNSSSNDFYINHSSTNNTIRNATLISSNGASTLLYIDTDTGKNTFCLNNFTNTSSNYVQDLNGTNYYNCTYGGNNQGNIWFNVMNGSINVTGITNSSISGLYIGNNGTGVPYNITKSAKFSCNFAGCADYAPLTNLNSATISNCSVLSTSNMIYNMSMNLTSNGTCFNITAQNVTLDCKGYWINYSTAGTANTMGVYSNQFNSTIKNCNIIDGNWTNSNSYRRGIDLNGSSNSSILNNFINVSNGNAILLESGSNFNNITNNTIISNSSSGINLSASSSNIFSSNKLFSGDGAEILLYLDSGASANKFYWNNFTNTSNKYVYDLNGTNKYNTTISGNGEGNIWFNVMNGSASIIGNISSNGYPSLYIGFNGTGYPYNSTTSSGKVTSNVYDYAPLTPNLSNTIPITITFLPPTPANGSNSSGRTQPIVANISSSTSQNTSAWIDFDRSLLGYWSMDYSNVSGIYDNSTYNNFGTYTGGINSSNITTGIRGKALTFDGINDYLNMATQNGLPTGNFKYTISAWVYPRNCIGSGSGCGIVVWGQYSDNNMNAFVIPNNCKLMNYWHNNDATSTGTVSLNTWSHVAVTYDGSNRTFYINGVMSGSFASSGLNIIAGPFEIGATAGDENFNGSLDELMIFNRSLSYAEILALYNSQANLFNATFKNLAQGQHNYTVYAIDQSGNRTSSGPRNFVSVNDTTPPNITFIYPPTPTNGSSTSSSTTNIVATITDDSYGDTSSWIDFDRSLVGYWAMDSYNASGIFDNSSYGNASTGNGFATFIGGMSNSSNIVTGARGKGVSFDGVNDQLVITDTIPKVNNSVTISAWVKFNQATVTSDWNEAIVSRNDIYGLLRDYYTNTIDLMSGTYILSGTQSTWNVGQWYHIVITANSTTGRIYINGVLDNSGPITWVPAYDYYNIEMGGNEGMMTDTAFNGSLDEVMIFNRTLSQSEVLALYNSQINKFNATLTNLTSGQHNYTVYAIDESGNLNNSGPRNFIAPNLISSCQTFLTANKVYALTANVTNAGTCFIVSAANVTLDCNGYKITYSTGGGTSTYGVSSNQFNTTIQNCNIVDGQFSSTNANR